MTNVKILSTMDHYGKYSSSALKRIKDEGYEIDFVPESDLEDRKVLPEILKDVVVWILEYIKVDDVVLSHAPNLKVICKHGTGVDNIDIEACNRRGVIVCNAPGANAEGVADLSFILMLSLGRNILKGDRMVRKGGWDRIISRSLNGQTLGIIGFGNIGKGLVRRVGSVYSMEFIAVKTRHPNEEFNKKYGVELVENYHEVLQRADYVLIAVPLTKETRNLMTKKEFAMMKSNACLIDVSRGGVVNQADLIEAINEGVIAGAALDVYEVEPPVNKDLLENEKIILSPHMGGFVEEDIGKISDMTTDNVLAFLQGFRPPYEIRRY